MSLANLVAFFSGNAGNVGVTPSLPKKFSNNNAVTVVTPVTKKYNDTKPEIVPDNTASNENLEVDVAESLGRSLSYLTNADSRLPGLCLFSLSDILDIETGILPLESAKRYLDSIERQYPHLQSGDSDDHPIIRAIDELKQLGLEIVPEDRRFIRERLGHHMNWKAELNEYLEVWLLAAATTPQPHKRQNAGRFAANTWLREGG